MALDKILNVAETIKSGVSTGLTGITNLASNLITSGPNSGSVRAANQSSIRQTAGQAFKKTDKYIYKCNIVQATSDPNNPLVAITAFLPEQISLDLSATYTPAFGHGVFDATDVTGKSARLMGYSGITQEMSVKIWESTDGISLSLPLIFVAGELIDRQGYSSVIDPIMDLTKLIAPRKIQGDVFLTPPGPKLTADPAKLAAAATGVAASGIGALKDGVVGAFDTLTTGKNSFSISDATKANWNQTGKDFQNIINFNNQISIYIGNFLYFDNVVINGVSQNYEMIPDANGKPMKAMVNLSFTTMFCPTVEDIQKIFLRNTNATTNGTKGR